MNTVELQIEVAGEWWCLNRRKCQPKDLGPTHEELGRMLADWENARYFDAGVRMRVQTVSAAG